MGIIANYYAISTQELNKLLSKKIEVEQDRFPSTNTNKQTFSITLDKMWDCLHFLLTGYKNSPELNEHKTIEDSLLYFAFFGECSFTNFETSEDFSYTTTEKVCQISQFLETIDFMNLLKNTNFPCLQDNNIYPNIWQQDKLEIALMLEILADYFSTFKDFYKKATQNNFAVLVIIG